MSQCLICHKEVTNIRKHCIGKWLNNAEDLEHLAQAIRLQPSAFVYLTRELKEVGRATGTEGHEPEGARDNRVPSGGDAQKSELERLLKGA